MQMAMAAVITIGLVGMFGLIALTVMLYATRYKIAPADQILVISGSYLGGKTALTIHGGGKLVLPLVQEYQYLDLTPMTISIDLKHALSLQNIRINVPSTFTIAISKDPSITQNAAERLLGQPRNQIESMASEIIFGQLRLTVATLTIEQINQDREAFLSRVSLNVDNELHKIGLYLVNVNVTDITDESNYIENIGREAAAKQTTKLQSMLQTTTGLVQLVSQPHRERKISKLQETLLHPLRVKSKQNRTSVSTYKNKKLWLYKVRTFPEQTLLITMLS